MMPYEVEYEKVPPEEVFVKDVKICGVINDGIVSGNVSIALILDDDSTSFYCCRPQGVKFTPNKTHIIHFSCFGVVTRTEIKE